MDVEKLIPKTGEYVFPNIYFDWGGGYRYCYLEDYPRIFHFQYEYWYDGRFFLLGNFDGKNMSLVDVETGAITVDSGEFKKQPSVKQIIQKLKDKLQDRGSSIHEVVRDFKCKNLDVETWLISSLSI